MCNLYLIEKAKESKKSKQVAAFRNCNCSVQNCVDLIIVNLKTRLITHSDSYRNCTLNTFYESSSNKLETSIFSLETDILPERTNCMIP
jgi:hypothetical protein